MQTGAAKELHTRDLKSGIDLSDEALARSWTTLKDGEGGHSWVLYGYAPDSQNRIALEAMGTGFEALLAALADDKVLFGGLKARCNTLTKYFSFMFVGESVGGMKKGRASLHKNGVLHGILEGVSGELTLPPKAELTQESLAAQIKKLTGASNVEI